MFSKVKNYCTRFVKDESGAELIEWGIAILIAGLLIGIAFSIATTTEEGMNKAQSEIKGAIDNFGGSGGGETENAG